MARLLTNLPAHSPPSRAAPARLDSAPQRARGPRPAWCWLLPGLGVVFPLATSAQVEREYFMRTPPHPVFSSPEQARYNLKLGKLTAHLVGNIQFEFNDNINLSQDDPRIDFSVGPHLGVGFLWPLTKNHVLQLDLGVGYRWYLQNPSVSSINVAPNTHLDYSVMMGDVRLTFHDRFSVQVDPVSRGELSGANRRVTSYRRLLNTAGLSADWRATKDLDLFGGYDFTLDRSLTADFQDIDRDEHTVYAGANYVLSQAAKGGLLGSYSVTDYQQAVQNDGESWTVGPNLTLKLSRWLTASASAGYTVSTYRPNGLIADASGYRGPTYQVGFQHTINQRTSHNLRFGESVGLGFGSNYTKNRLLQYNLQTLLTKAISLNTIFAYEWLEASGGVGDRAERFLLYFGSGYQFTRAWSAGVSYSLALRDSALPGRDYLQNRLTIDLTRRF